MQGKSRWQKQKEEEVKKEMRRESRAKEKKQKKEKTIDVKRVAEEWEIWDEKEKIAKSEGEAKKLVPEKFHK